ncbi:hypothetical protein FOA52_003718 [Chlamydomonas sp. UWO 241]|nr:hypothetical protein FOA52_003718 [Chlamydomonas sp. UWO 241]
MVPPAASLEGMGSSSVQGKAGPSRFDRWCGVPVQRVRPGLLLLLFSYGMLLIWMDQGTISATQVQGQRPGEEYTDYADGVPGLIPSLGLSTTQYSLLGPSFTIGIVFGSFGFAAAARHTQAMWLLAGGTVLWAVGSVLAGAAPNFAAMVVARVLGGAGAAAIMTLTFPFIDDVAPVRHRTLWFGCLGLCQPVGVALGYIAMGAVASGLGWRAAFYVQAALCTPPHTRNCYSSHDSGGDPSVGSRGAAVDCAAALCTPFVVASLLMPHITLRTRLLQPGDAGQLESSPLVGNGGGGGGDSDGAGIGGSGGSGGSGGTGDGSASSLLRAEHQQFSQSTSPHLPQSTLPHPSSVSTPHLSSPARRRAAAAASGGGGGGSPAGSRLCGSVDGVNGVGGVDGVNGVGGVGDRSGRRVAHTPNPAPDHTCGGQWARASAGAGDLATAALKVIRLRCPPPQTPQASLTPWKCSAALEVIRLRAWSYNNFGYLPVAFVLSMYAYWAPRIVKSLYSQLSNSDADLIMGGTIVVAGIAGSLGGGLALDRLGASLNSGFMLSTLCACVSAVFLILPMTLPGLPLWAFILLNGIGTLGATALNPINYALSMWTVHPSARPMSQSLLILCQRAFGDIPAPPVIAAIHETVGDWATACAICLSILSLSIGLYAAGWADAGRCKDWREAYDEQEAAELEAEDDKALITEPGHASGAAHRHVMAEGGLRA